MSNFFQGVPDRQYPEETARIEVKNRARIAELIRQTRILDERILSKVSVAQRNVHIWGEIKELEDDVLAIYHSSSGDRAEITAARLRYFQKQLEIATQTEERRPQVTLDHVLIQYLERKIAEIQRDGFGQLPSGEARLKEIEAARRHVTGAMDVLNTRPTGEPSEAAKLENINDPEIPYYGGYSDYEQRVMENSAAVRADTNQ